MAAPSVVYKGRLSSIPKYIVLTGGGGYLVKSNRIANDKPKRCKVLKQIILGHI